MGYLDEENRIELSLFLLTGLERIPLGVAPVAPDPQSYLSRQRNLTLASLLKEVGEKAAMTNAALGREIGVNPATMSRIMNGHQKGVTNPTVIKLRLLMKMVCPALLPDLDYLTAQMKEAQQGGFYRDGRGRS